MLLRYEPITAVSEKVADQMLGIGIKGAIWGAQALLQHRKADRAASIVNMASPVAERGYPNTAIYSCVKGALVTLTKTLSAELGPQGSAGQRHRARIGTHTRRCRSQRQGRI